MKKVLVTGAAGFIGYYVVEHYKRIGFEVLGLDDFRGGNTTFPKSCTQHIVADICTINDLPDVDVIVHLAAEMPVVRPPFEDPIAHDRVNVHGTINLLKILSKKTNKPKFFYASSCAVYGEGSGAIANGGFKETSSPIELQSRTYTISKFSGEQYALLLGQRYAVPVTVGRLFANVGLNGYNPGKAKNSYSPVVSIFLKQWCEKSPLTVTGDGSQSRDFVMAEDTALAIQQLLECEEATGQIVNICTNQGMSVYELARLISDTIVYVPRTHGEVEHILGCNDKLTQYGCDAPRPLKDCIEKLKGQAECLWG